MFKIKIVFPERFPRPDKYSWGISYEYLPGWPELTEEKIIRLCLCHTSYLHKLLKMHILQKKKNLSIPEAATRAVLWEKLFLRNFWIFTGKKLCWSPFLIEMQAWRSVILLKETLTQQHRCLSLWILQNVQEHLFWRISSGNCLWNSCVLLLIFLPRGLFLLLIQYSFFKVLFNV